MRSRILFHGDGSPLVVDGSRCRRAVPTPERRPRPAARSAGCAVVDERAVGPVPEPVPVATGRAMRAAAAAASRPRAAARRRPAARGGASTAIDQIHAAAARQQKIHGGLEHGKRMLARRAPARPAARRPAPPAAGWVMRSSRGQGRRVGEDQPAQGRAVDAVADQHHAGPKARATPPRTARLRQHLVAQPVAVDHGRAALGQQGRSPTTCPRRSGPVDHPAPHPWASAQLRPLCRSTTSGTFSSRAPSMPARTSCADFVQFGRAAPPAPARHAPAAAAWRRSPRRSRSAWMRIMASLIRSAAVPWIGVLTATRSWNGADAVVVRVDVRQQAAPAQQGLHPAVAARLLLGLPR